MALKTFVKVSGVNNLSDARYCAGMGVDVLGFSFDPSDQNHVAPDLYVAITEWISGVQYTAEFNTCTPEEIEKQLAQYSHVDLLQITEYSHLALLKHLQLPMILKIDMGQCTDLASLAEIMHEAHQDVLYFLLENESQYDRTEWLNDVLHLADQYPVLLGFGVDPDNINSILEHSNIKGIALKGGEEVKPGYKTYDELADILEIIEIDE